GERRMARRCGEGAGETLAVSAVARRSRRGWTGGALALAVPRARGARFAARLVFWVWGRGAPAPPPGAGVVGALASSGDRAWQLGRGVLQHRRCAARRDRDLRRVAAFGTSDAGGGRLQRRNLGRRGVVVGAARAALGAPGVLAEGEDLAV